MVVIDSIKGITHVLLVWASWICLLKVCMGVYRLENINWPGRYDPAANGLLRARDHRLGRVRDSLPRHGSVDTARIVR